MIRIALAAGLWLAAALPAAAFVDIEEVETPGGFTAWLVEAPEIPFVALEFRFRGGTSVDPEDARGAVNLMTGLLEEGAGDLDAQGFAAAREDLAARISFDAGDDAVAVSAQFLSDTTEAAGDLIRLALTEPRFDAGAVERVRGQVLSGLRQDLDDPNAIASREFSALAFGDHPYGTPGDGTVESVTALTRDDLIAAHQGALAKDRVMISAVGDIDAERLATLIDSILADLPAEGAPLPGPAEVMLDGGTHVVPFDTPQSVIQFGHDGIAFDDPDYFPAFVVNQILGGGGFGARLMEEVREKRGLTYGIYTYLAEKDQADLMAGRVATQNARVSETLDVVMAEWRRMAEDGPTEEELDRAKTYLTGAYPLRFDGNSSIANMLVGMQMNGMPIDYAETRNDRVAAVTLEDARRVAADLLDPEALTFVVVGQPEGLATGN